MILYRYFEKEKKRSSRENEVLYTAMTHDIMKFKVYDSVSLDF